jgi:hypothetical protein
MACNKDALGKDIWGWNCNVEQNAAGLIESLPPAAVIDQMKIDRKGRKNWKICKKTRKGGKIGYGQPNMFCKAFIGVCVGSYSMGGGSGYFIWTGKEIRMSASFYTREELKLL